MPINIDSRDFVLPGNDRVLGALSDFAANQRRDKELLAQQKRQQQQDKFRTAELIKDSFEPAKLLTGQKEIDAKINEDLNVGLQQVLQKASQHGYDPIASINDIRNAINGPAQLSQKVKSIKTSNKQYIDAVSKMYPDADVAALQDMAEKNAFLTTDPVTGRQTYKPIDQIDDSKSYIGEILDNTPEQVLKGNGGFVSNIEKNYKPSKVSSDDTEGQYRGAKQRYKWSADVNNFQELYTDKNGQVSGVRTKVEKAKVFGKDENVLPQKEFDNLMEDDQSKLIITARANQYIKSQGKEINRLSSDYMLAKRKAAYDLMEAHVPKNFHPVESNIKAPVTNIYMRDDKYSSAMEGNRFIKDAMKAIESKDSDKIQEVFSTLSKGGDYVNIKAVPKGDVVEITYQTPSKKDANGVETGLSKITRTVKNDVNELKGVYQALTGKDAKFEKSELPKPKPSSKKGILD